MAKLPEHLYGLIGFPLGHSFSQNYFNQKFEAENISAKYVNFEIDDIGRLMEIIAQCHNSIQAAGNSLYGRDGS